MWLRGCIYGQAALALLLNIFDEVFAVGGILQYSETDSTALYIVFENLLTYLITKAIESVEWRFRCLSPVGIEGYLGVAHIHAVHARGRLYLVACDT